MTENKPVIEFAFCPRIGQEAFPDLKSAQCKAIELLFVQDTAFNETNLIEIASAIVFRRAAIIEILTTTDPAAPKPARKPRKDKGTKRATKAEGVA